MAELFSQPVNKILPHIFEKNAVCVPPSTPLENVCHFLFATKHYQDGIVVTEDDFPIGRIGGGHILWQVRQNIKDLKKKPVSEIMDKLPMQFSEDRDLLEILELFKKNRFCFAPIKTKEGKIVTLAVRDLLPLVAKMKIGIPIRTIYSKMIFVSEGIQIKDALDIMFNNHIRRLGIECDTEPVRIINDRDILEYLCFIQVLEEDVLIKKIDHIRSQKIVDIDPNTSISDAAELLMSNLACSVDKHHIVTPYDVVSKTILSQIQT